MHFSDFFRDLLRMQTARRLTISESYGIRANTSVSRNWYCPLLWWDLGYKVHIVADANHGLPLAHLGTTARSSDSPELLPELLRDMAHADRLYSWDRPPAPLTNEAHRCP